MAGQPVGEGDPLVRRNGVHHELGIVGTVKRLRERDGQLGVGFLASYGIYLSAEQNCWAVRLAEVTQSYHSVHFPSLSVLIADSAVCVY